MLKIGVIGAGHLGKIHIKLLKEIESFELVGFFDNDSFVREAVSMEFDIKSFADANELIELCDAVDIVVPTLFHHEYALKCLRLSKHIFIEKPLANTIDEAKELIKTVAEANVKVQVGHVERFNPAFIAALPSLKNPMFIETHRLAQFNPRGTDVPVVMDLMVHDIDIVLAVVKSSVKKISASGVSIVSDTPDIANARIEFDNGCVANLTASRLSMKNMRKSRFFQKDAYISVDFLKKKTEVIRMSNENINENPFAMEIDLGEKGKKYIEFEKPEVYEVNAIKAELKSFADAILNDTDTLVNIDAGYQALNVAHEVVAKMK
ncbi:MAG TPA: Gfo/Idh/MocA family oxidoreductase [Bacteroidia bacterium]|nr:Gfo/Idh/MocA family oxidoreductase [Bacteroidia bacterium]HNU33013.1 Gfo/Idh/MocA family oxidoreductase [Bacteroidia bacterium]